MKQKYMKLISNDNHEFYLPLAVGQISGLINTWINTDIEKKYNYKVNINKVILKILIEFMFYNYENQDKKLSEVPKFKIEPKYSLEILKASQEFDL